MSDSQKKSYVTFILLAGAVVALDQLVKAIIVSKIPAYHSVPVIPGFFRQPLRGQTQSSESLLIVLARYQDSRGKGFIRRTDALCDPGVKQFARCIAMRVRSE